MRACGPWCKSVNDRLPLPVELPHFGKYTFDPATVTEPAADRDALLHLCGCGARVGRLRPWQVALARQLPLPDRGRCSAVHAGFSRV
jgi:hypothetical protein